ncbi:MAG: DUF134 domain-containing protein [Bacillota bacterium]
MPRPRKFRTVCCLPANNVFGPHKKDLNMQRIVMSVDEYETIRLIDFEKLTQQECAENMNIARTTVQSVYERARVKIADCIVNGKTLLIEGGDYQLCDHVGGECGKKGCFRHRYNNKA